jgi:hypothetical protein
LKSAITIALFASLVAGQTFKGHHIGETAEEFFSTSTVEGAGVPAIPYCKGYLNDATVLGAYDRARSHPTDIKASRASADFDGCVSVQNAIAGKSAKISAHFAEGLSSGELGAGYARFHDHRLVILNFFVERAPFEDVLTDVKEKLHSTPDISTRTSENIYGAILNERTAVWTVNDLNVVVSEVRTFQQGDLGVNVTVSDLAFLQQEAAEREAKRPNTLD